MQCDYINQITKNCLPNKYTKWYINICKNAKTRLISLNKIDAKQEANDLFGYVEGHHIWPQCLCNESEKKDFDNYAFLTGREHVNYCTTKDRAACSLP